jgi:hypothetical protein
MLCWAVSCFRPERNPEITKVLFDIGWESIELQWSIATVQMVAMAVAGLCDDRATPLFPSWVCWLSIWCVRARHPHSLSERGPFAWDGLLSFYIPYSAWLVWCRGDGLHD